jgi:hypothetical protein
MNRTLLGPFLLLVAALVMIGIITSGAGTFAAGGGKSPTVDVVLTQSSIGDFNLGSLFHTQLEPIDDGSVALQAIGLAGGWNATHADGMPARFFHASAVVGNHIYVFGGASGSFGTPYATCYVADIQADHTLSAWRAVTSLPRGLDDMAAVAVGSNVYVLGGFDGTSSRAEVYRATSNADGSLSSTWTADRTMPEAVAHLGATTANNFIYVVGGEHDFPPASAHSYFAHVNSDGSLGTWTQTTDLPAPDYNGGASGHILTSYSDGTVTKVYIATGFGSTGAAVPDVYSATADRTSGVLSQWTANTNYSQNLVYSAGVSYGTQQCGGNLYFSGGLQNQSQQATDYVATAVLSQAPTYFAGGWYTTSNLGIARYGHSMVASNDGWLYVIDGSDSLGNPIASVRYGETACAAAGGAIRAPSGYFQSLPWDLGDRLPLIRLNVNTTLTQSLPISLTFSYRYSNDAGFNGVSFSDPVAVTPGYSQTTQVDLGRVTAQYLQYRLDFARADTVLTSTGFLNWVSLTYDGVLPPTATPTTPGVDLVASGISVSSYGGTRPSADHPIMLNIGVTNAGSVAAPPGHYEVDGYMHLSGTPQPSDPSDAFGAVDLTQPLQPGQVLTVTTNSMPATPGPLTLYGWVNRNRYIAETNYGNNIAGPVSDCVYRHDHQSFSDVPDNQYFYTPVEFLSCHGAVSGYSNGTFKPYNTTTRGQFTKMVVLAVGWPIETPLTGTWTFADVPPASTFFAVVETAYSHHAVSGYGCGGTNEPCDSQRRPYYRVNANISRGQLAKITVLAKAWPLLNPATPTFRDVPTTNPYYTFVETAVAKGIISGYSCGQGCLEFRPNNSGTRGQLSKILYLGVTQP